MLKKDYAVRANLNDLVDFDSSLKNHYRNPFDMPNGGDCKRIFRSFKLRKRNKYSENCDCKADSLD